MEALSRSTRAQSFGAAKSFGAASSTDGDDNDNDDESVLEETMESRLSARLAKDTSGKVPSANASEL